MSIVTVFEQQAQENVWKGESVRGIPGVAAVWPATKKTEENY
jgi:hypothetical protein